jgi:hypothetical protein
MRRSVSLTSIQQIHQTLLLTLSSTRHSSDSGGDGALAISAEASWPKTGDIDGDVVEVEKALTRKLTCNVELMSFSKVPILRYRARPAAASHLRSSS